MSKKDTIYEEVKTALIKEGWKITSDPYRINFEGERVFIDIAAEAPFEAEREGNKIVIEVKSFRAPSLLNDMHEAIGQYINYRVILEHIGLERVLYLAFDQEALGEFRERKGLRILLEASQVHGLAIDTETLETIKWIENWDTVP